MPNLRMYLIFRGDLPQMTRGKSEVQAAHAAASLIYMAHVRNLCPETQTLLKDYMGGQSSPGFTNEVDKGQMKLALEVENLDGIWLVRERCLKRSVPFVIIKDAAHTVFLEPTITCIGVGPCSKTDGNAITRGLKLRD